MLTYSPYTHIDNEFIRDNYQELSDAQIATLLSRTPHAIRKQRSALKLKRPPAIYDLLHSRHVITKEIAQLNNMLHKGIMTDIVRARLTALATSRTINSPKSLLPLRTQAKIYEMHISGMSNYKISRALKLNDRTPANIIALISPYSGPNPVTITIPSKL